MVHATKQTVADTVRKALQEVQDLGGHACPTLAPGAPVIGTLEEFDSLTGIEATLIVEQRLAEALGALAPLDLKLDSIFVSKDGRRALSFEEVVANVCGVMGVAA
jgi:hypothetical protein